MMELPSPGIEVKPAERPYEYVWIPVSLLGGITIVYLFVWGVQLESSGVTLPRFYEIGTFVFMLAVVVASGYAKGAGKAVRVPQGYLGYKLDKDGHPEQKALRPGKYDSEHPVFVVQNVTMPHQINHEVETPDGATFALAITYSIGIDSQNIGRLHQFAHVARELDDMVKTHLSWYCATDDIDPKTKKPIGPQSERDMAAAHYLIRDEVIRFINQPRYGFVCPNANVVSIKRIGSAAYPGSQAFADRLRKLKTFTRNNELYRHEKAQILADCTDPEERRRIESYCRLIEMDMNDPR